MSLDQDTHTSGDGDDASASHDLAAYTSAQEDVVPDPGFGEHEWRPTDVDAGQERRAERQVATFYTVSMVMSVLFVVSYFAIEIGANADHFLGNSASTMALGATLGLALLCIGVGTIQWARKLMSDHEIVEERHPAASPEEDREATVEALNQGTEDSGIGRRPLIRNTLLGSLAMLGLPAVVALRDLGPLPGDKLFHTVWEKGMRVVRDVVGTPIKPSDLQIGDLVNAQPAYIFEHEEELSHTEVLQIKAKAPVIVVKMKPEEINHGKGRENWTVEGVIAYSKICTHVGCPISLYAQQTHHVLCPCHQSTFDLADSARVLFGPAARPLPQLPLSVDDEDYLIAQSDFTEPVGPSFWERG